MMWTPTAGFARNALVLLLLTVPSSAFAALGGTTDSVDADRVHVQGALMRIVRVDAYALHEIRSATAQEDSDATFHERKTVAQMSWETKKEGWGLPGAVSRSRRGCRRR